MKGLGFISSALATGSLLAAGVCAQSWKTIPALEIKGQHFWYTNNGSQFQIMGVAYQQDYESNNTDTNIQYTDPLADTNSCKRDIPNLIALRTNTIRVYAIDPTQNHDDCMAMLADAGIYVVADLSEPSTSINRDDPNWNVPLYQRYTAVVDALAKYNNVLGFFAGNEVSNSFNTTAASAFVKAAVRDTKGYITSNGYRPMGVGYATYDGDIRDELAQYFNCGDASESIDFWGYNVYSWCGDSDFKTSGYSDRVEFFKDYSVPVFFAEYGCIKTSPRPFTEVGTIFGDEMTPTWSGGIVYMYFQEVNNYGLVEVNGDSVSTLQDFDNLSSQMAKVTPTWTSSNSRTYSPNLSATTCPSVYSSGTSAWLATASPLPPPPNPALCACEVRGFGCATTSNNATAYGDVFSYICGQDPDACSGIGHNATTGDYGAISMCSPKDQLSFVMNQYWLNHGKGASACSFNGLAATKASQSPSGTCANLLNAVGTDLSGAVPSPSGNTDAQNSAAGVSGSQAAASSLVGSTSSLGSLVMGLYVLVAAGAGAGMLLL